MWPVVVLMCVIPGHSTSSWDPQLDQHWELWKTSYNKTYKEMEEGWRRIVWEKNLKKIELHNLEHSMGKHSFTLGMNHFGDMTEEEFAQIMLGYKPTNEGLREKSLFEKSNIMEIPSTVDWREKGYVTPVKDQGYCGSCWAFSATGALEGQLFKKTGKLVSLSEQNLVDCSRPQGNWGCQGGWMDRAFRYVMYNGGLDSEASYPYVGKDQICKYNPLYSSVKVSGYHGCCGGNENVLMYSVATVGPISVAIDASDPFRFYHSGIYYNERCSIFRPNHAVLVVGYGFQNSSTFVDKYWIVKNSWSTIWGKNGYIYMAKDKGNNCGIASIASYPDVY